MPDRAALEALLARIEGARDGDSDLDYLIAFHVLGFPTGAPYTSSLDAAVALCSRALPGWCWAVWTFTSIGEKPEARVQGPDDDSCPECHRSIPKDFMASAPTPALALCIATCKALLA